MTKSYNDRRSLIATTICAILMSAACKGKSDPAPTPAPPPAAAVDAAAPAPTPTPTAAIDAAAAPTPTPTEPEAATNLDPKVLDGVKPLKPDAKKRTVDATAAGATVAVKLVQRLGPPVADPDSQFRAFELLLVLSGTSTVAIDLGQQNDAISSADPEGTLSLLEANDDPAANLDDDGGLPKLPSKSPMLYRTQFHITGASDDFIVTQEGDSLVVWNFTRDEGAVSKEWFKLAIVKLAAGAKVTAS
ncbi:MAG: hypothetical protein K8W52_20465 [Deltaproteobacteria bacterium]|nr:hypothetical protein [Deltaproteobacteria bacterium]